MRSGLFECVCGHGDQDHDLGPAPRDAPFTWWRMPDLAPCRECDCRDFVDADLVDCRDRHPANES